jgi:hypothetical protein
VQVAEALVSILASWLRQVDGGVGSAPAGAAKEKAMPKLMWLIRPEQDAACLSKGEHDGEVYAADPG